MLGYNKQLLLNVHGMNITVGSLQFLNYSNIFPYWA